MNLSGYRTAISTWRRTMTKDDCTWPQGICKCWEIEQSKPDPHGRVWMHCEEGLSFTKASVSRFVMFCLSNNIHIEQIHPFNANFPGCQVSAVVRIHPSQIEAFERETKGKLRTPPKIILN